jgi:hypothetical protein
MGACCTKVHKTPIKAVSERNNTLIQTESKFPAEMAKSKAKVNLFNL